MVYAGKLTTEVDTMVEADIVAMRAANANDGEILEVNQLISNGMVMMIWIYIDGTTSQDLVKVRGILMHYLNC